MEPIAVFIIFVLFWLILQYPFQQDPGKPSKHTIILIIGIILFTIFLLLATGVLHFVHIG
jgi:hypothetical protein